MKSAIQTLILITFTLTTLVQCQNRKGTVTDIDGNVYKTVKIGEQVWMAENLKVTRYRNGNRISNVTNNSRWSKLKTGAYCAYDNDDINIKTYGLLYNWFAVNDSRSLAPVGWHIPSSNEWKYLEKYLGISTFRQQNSSKLKATKGWPMYGNGTNESGFTAIPSGSRNPFKGSFKFLGQFGYYWLTNGGTSGAWHTYACGVEITDDTYVRNCSGIASGGRSVRCIKD
ncbi:MAG: hypothetical protein GWP19_06170 [Planctomycetia bacterium]|nr:hypothetical protein [Planctomycetia bacterium]